MSRLRLLPLALLASAISLVTSASRAQVPEETPEVTPAGVEQIIPRGAIPAVFEPRFVAASEAELPGDAWVLGVVVDGEARAYSLNLLNRHEIVNDQIGEKSFAAVWWPLANTAVVYDRTIDDKTLNFEASGALKSASLVMRDRETDSWWSIMSSKAIGGSLAGTELSELPVGEKSTWSSWVSRYPETLVLSVEGSEHVDTNPYDNYFDSNDTFRGLEIDDQRLEAKQPIFSFWVDGSPVAVPFQAFEGGRIFKLDDGRSILLTRPRDSPIFLSSTGYLLDGKLDSAKPVDQILQELGESATRLEGFDTYWYTWVSVNPGTALLE